MARTTSKRTGGTVATTAASADTLAIGTDETPEAYVRRLVQLGTAAAISAAETAVAADDDRARLHTFEDRVRRSVMAGLTAVGRFTADTGAAPTDYAALAKHLGVSTDGGTYIGRKYSTLRECYRLAVTDTPDKRDAFIAAFSEATGRNPEQVRDYVKWADAKGGNAARFNTVAVLAKREADAIAAAETAKADAAARRATTDALAAAGVVKGCPLTAAQWSAMSEETLAHVEMLAASLRVKLGVTRRAAERAAKANATAAETGPQPTTSARTRRARTTAAA